MEQWQDVSNSIFSADNLSIASLSGIVNNLAQTYGAEPVELLDFSNSYVFSNINIEEHDDAFPGITLIDDWETGVVFDLKGTWNWGLGENLAPETYETTSIKFNPNVQLYGYFDTWFNFSFEWFYFEISVYFKPVDVKLLDIDLQIPNGSGSNFCAEISAQTSSVLLEVNTNWAWPNCGWGFFQHFFGHHIIPSNGGENGCKLVYMGRSFGNDTPAWKDTFLDVLDNKIEILPQVCLGSAAVVPVEQPVVDDTTPVEEAPAAM